MPTIFWAADSTVAFNSYKTHPQVGLGQALPLYLKTDVQIKNCAINGRSTKSFIDEGRLDEIDSMIRRGDYLFIQFGHNDQKIEDPARYAAPFTDYQTNLARFVEVARKHGAQPLLITPIYRRHLDDNGKLKDKVHLDYPDAMLQLAQKLNVPAVDLCEKSRKLLAATDKEITYHWFMNLAPGQFPSTPDGRQDDTHLRYEGAFQMANLLAEGLRELGEPFTSLLL